MSAAELASLRARLAATTGAGVPGADLIAVVEELRAVQAAAAAALVRVCVAAAKHSVRVGQEQGLSLRQLKAATVNELALAHRVSPASMSRRLETYRRLVADLPRTLQTMADGDTSEHTVMVVAKAAHNLNPEDSADLDAGLAPVVASLTPAQAEGHVRRFCADRDPETILRRMAEAAKDTRVGIRPMADGMARLSILAPLTEAVGMYAALRREALATRPAGVGLGRQMVTLAFQRLTGLAAPEQLGVEIGLVMDDQTLLGTGSAQPARLTEATTGVTGGWIPASLARALALGHSTSDPARPDSERAGPRWIRRLFTDPVSGTLTAMDTRRRDFTPAQARYLAIRDQYCTTPWCGAPIRHADHARPFSQGGATDLVQGNGKCERCNLNKDLPGWTTTATGAVPGHGHRITVTTPAGRSYTSTSPPVLSRPEPCRVEARDRLGADTSARQEQRQSQGRSAAAGVVRGGRPGRSEAVGSGSRVDDSAELSHPGVSSAMPCGVGDLTEVPAGPAESTAAQPDAA